MNEKVGCMKILGCAYEVLTIDLGIYLDKGKYKWFIKIQDL